MSAACVISAARGPQRSAGQRIPKVIAALASRVSVTATPSSPASSPSVAEVDRQQDAEKAIAEGAGRLRDEDEPGVTSHA